MRKFWGLGINGLQFRPYDWEVGKAIYLVVVAAAVDTGWVCAGRGRNGHACCLTYGNPDYHLGDHPYSYPVSYGDYDTRAYTNCYPDYAAGHDE